MSKLGFGPVWRRLLALFVIVGVSAAAAGAWLLAAGGDLDPAFGSGGVVLTDVSAPHCCEGAGGMAIQPDGKMVVAGSVFDTSNNVFPDYDFMVARYHSDGTLDPLFGTGGIVTTKFFTNSLEAGASIALQPDGKIVVAGQVDFAGVSYMAIARYLADGRLDPAFDGDGKVNLPFDGRYAEARAVAVQADGKIVVAGTATDNFYGDADMALARLNSDGSVDATFGVLGRVLTVFAPADPNDPFSAPYETAYALAVQPDGRILAAGYAAAAARSHGDMAVVRYTPNGLLDPSFGNAGQVRFNFYGHHAEATGIALQPDGKIVLGGSARNASASLLWEFAVARLDANGILDPAFDGDGKATTRVEQLDARANALALQPDGQIVMAGVYVNSVAVARYRSNGTPDTSFSGDGVATTDLGGYETAAALAVQAGGRIVTAGTALPLSGGGNFAKLLLLGYEGGSSGIQQTIDFAPLPDRIFGEPPFTVSATATSGLPVTFSAGGACTVSGSTVTLTTSGTCSITASQVGNATYAAAPDVTQSFQVLNGRVLGITRAGTGTGRVTSASPGIDCGSDCSETYADGSVVTLLATADPGSTFVGWSGDADCTDGTLTMTANRACIATFDKTATTTTIASSLNPSAFGQAVTFTATVTGTSPTGTVTIRDGAVALAPPVPLSAGTATLSVSQLTVGTHSITAHYSGDLSNAPSTSAPLSQVVDKASATVTLASTPNPSTSAEAVTFSGTVPSAATGSVSILDGVTSIGAATIANGTFSIAITSLNVGSHTVIARYDGDGNYLAGDSALLTHVVTTANRAPQITPVQSQTVTWGVLLSLPVFATDADNDPLTYSLVNPPVGAAISSSGQFTWTPSSAQVGPTSITVEVSDGALTASASFTVNVGKRATTLGYLGPGAAGAGPVQLSARLLDYQNAPIAGRTIAFQLGTQGVSATTDATGLAVATVLLNQPVGTLTVSATFAGDAAYTGSSSAFNFRVNAPPVVGAIAAQSIPWGTSLGVLITASDPDGGALTFSLLNPPAGAALNFESATARRLVWTPSQQQMGAATITIAVSDDVSTTTASVPVTVLRRPASVGSLGPGAAGVGLVTLTATLTDALLGHPLGGRSIAFTLGPQSTSASTNATGVATGALDLLQPPQTLPLNAVFTGDALYAPAQASRPFVIFSDTDGDGIRDEWEIAGVDINGDGTIDLNLPAMGANPLRKDIFVEADWMVKPFPCIWLVCWSNGGSLQPQKAALDALIQGFATAPVSNPDGSIGITLHVDGGPATVMNPATGEPWGARSRAGVVPYSPTLGSIDALGNYDWTQFESLKQAFMEPARRAVFHYVIYADTLAGTATGGISRGIGAADFVLAAGHPTWNGGLTVTQERSLFMHELGHNLRLRHGGADDLNYKPNYHSVLNYSWSLIGVPPNGRPDYSNVVEPPIDEAVVGDVNSDGRQDTLLGFDDWRNLWFSGGGIGDLQALPSPMTTPIDPIDPVEFRARGIYARAGDGLLAFKGPSVLVMNSGVQALSIDVKNISATDAAYVVSATGVLLPGAPSAAESVAAGGVARVTLPIDTTGLVAGEYVVTLSLRSAAGELLHWLAVTIAVVDLTVPANQQAAQDALVALAALPPDSGLDPAIRDQLVAMLAAVAPSWTTSAHVTGHLTFDATYQVAEPVFGRAPGPIAVDSLAGAPQFELRLLRAGKVATGTIRMRRPTGELFEAAVAGRWNESTRVFDGKWADHNQKGGAIVLRIVQP